MRKYMDSCVSLDILHSTGEIRRLNEDKFFSLDHTAYTGQMWTQPILSHTSYRVPGILFASSWCCNPHHNTLSGPEASEVLHHSQMCVVCSQLCGPLIHMLSLNININGRGGLWEMIRVWGPALTHRVRELLDSSTMWGHRERLWTKRQVRIRHWLQWPGNLAFPALRTVRNNFLLFISYSVCAARFRRPKWTKLMGFSNLTPFKTCLCSWESCSTE